MYIGMYYHKVESKNRFSLPVAFRGQIGSRLIITRGLDGCLFVFDLATWEKQIATSTNLSFTKKNNRDFVRLLTNTASEVEVDEQGRVLLPEHLKTAAKIEKEIVVVGSQDRLEVWDRDTYHQYLTDIESRAEQIAETIELEGQ